MSQHLKCDYLVTPQNFCAKFLCACLAWFCLLMHCFCLKLLYVYEIGIAPNFRFKFCNCISSFIMWCYVANNYCQICWKNWKLSSVKSMCRCTDVCAVKRETGSGRPKTADTCIRLCMLLVVCDMFNVLSCLRCYRPAISPLPVLSFMPIHW